MPIAQVILAIAHGNGKLTSDKASQNLRLLVWAIQFFVGLIGVWLAGKVAISTAKESGWRHTPKMLWRLFWQAGQY
jgi:multisubunit Na+/H+ antiporter MnhB subunit